MAQKPVIFKKFHHRRRPDIYLRFIIRLIEVNYLDNFYLPLASVKTQINPLKRKWRMFIVIRSKQVIAIYRSATSGNGTELKHLF